MFTQGGAGAARVLASRLPQFRDRPGPAGAFRTACSDLKKKFVESPLRRLLPPVIETTRRSHD
ncbi:hypothetical protein [Azohydromonas aeria]|uniref:hypothetical protein n=1 Tax=Azohydromonas aeria TaxID=2590212 RepID=UPI0012FBEF95|nr:hypothetical protein [Azohydromonas aeria]